ncbi:hypothetical protein [Telmatospirillum siberiense]|uniref:Uncharacterized protein n=1 Tax=Telmatospirillum siberiense TaxID=382514 RepID=A0A2N3PZJ8_9PROT|nr:hypothetical protein [Telmatospirillum siberiense]PKU25818.1 hypothetical protein CWS72_04470 [Telmatospirillum siberiense]
MIGDVMRAEAEKLRRDGRLLFWGFLSVPCAFFLFQLAAMLFFRAAVVVDVSHVDGVRDLSHALGIGGNLLAEIFLAGGAAGLMAGDYRWETWRYIVPRSGRTALIAGKVLVFVLAVAAVVCLVGLAAVVLGFLEAGLWRHPMPRFDGLATALVPLAAAFLASVLKVAIWGALAALLAVITRSPLATLSSVSLIIVIEAVTAGRLSIEHLSPLQQLAVPSLAVEMLLNWSVGSGGADGIWPLLAPLSLAGMAVLLAAAAAVLFHWQDLARE